MKKLKTTIKTFVPAILLAIISLISSCTPKQEPAAYLFTYFTGNGPGEEAIRYAVSEDGFN